MSESALESRTRQQQNLARAAELRTHAAAAALKPRLAGAGPPPRRGFDILQQFDHPLAGRAHDFGDASNHSIFLPLEHLDGSTLTRTLLEQGPLAPARVAALADHLAGALDAAHALGFLHRGIAPECIVRHADAAGREAWKLLDFGLAAAPRIDVDDAARDADSAAAALLGSARYASPEAAAGKPLTPASDVYSLAAALYEALAGVPPFEGDTDAAVALAHLREAPAPFAQANPETAVPAALEAAIMAALDKRPNRRPASAGELATRIRVALGRPPQDIAIPAAAAAPNRFHAQGTRAMNRPLSIRERVQTPQRLHLVGGSVSPPPTPLPKREKLDTVSWDNVAAAAAAPEEIVLRVKLSHAIIAILSIVAVTGSAFLILRGG